MNNFFFYLIFLTKTASLISQISSSNSIFFSHSKGELFEVSFKMSFYGCLHKTKYEYLISFCIESKNIYQNNKSYEDKSYNYKVTKLK